MAEATQEQPQQPQQPKEMEREAVRHGSRWLHRHPSEDQVRDWFGQQRLHKEMEHDPYIGGVVVIGSTDKPKVTKYKGNGDAYTVEVEVAVFTPYVKVDTRIAYFWDLVRKMNELANDDKYVGAIDPVKVPVIKNENSAYYNEHLPEGYSFHAVKENQEGQISRYIVATFETAIYERETYARVLNGSRERPVLKGRGSKQVAVKKRFADDNAIMKAETGSIGRALGMAGILVVGTGVATAEDMQENSAATTNPTSSETPLSPPAVVSHAAEMPVDAAVPAEATTGAAVPETVDPADEDAKLRTRALALQSELQSDHAEVWEAYKGWWQSRNFGALSDLGGPALKGAVIKLERDLEAAKTAVAGA